MSSTSIFSIVLVIFLAINNLKPASEIPANKNRKVSASKNVSLGFIGYIHPPIIL
ncbi:uncharacterized protein METZ01_LOCUS213908 [marine metagenome]|uniref:Uncharacterized protein n=1 Tax=marine metagenome TaxID=408172 RepID=A0A382FFF6_9ZZZZ